MWRIISAGHLLPYAGIEISTYSIYSRPATVVVSYHIIRHSLSRQYASTESIVNFCWIQGYK